MNRKRDHDYDSCLNAIDIRYSRTRLALLNQRHPHHGIHSRQHNNSMFEVFLQTEMTHAIPAEYTQNLQFIQSMTSPVSVPWTGYYCIPCTAVPNLQCHLAAQYI